MLTGGNFNGRFLRWLGRPAGYGLAGFFVIIATYEITKLYEITKFL